MKEYAPLAVVLLEFVMTTRIREMTAEDIDQVRKILDTILPLRKIRKAAASMIFIINAAVLFIDS